MRTIILKPSGVGRYGDVSPFMITDNSLELKVELPNVNGEFYFIAENNGKQYKKLLPRDGAATLDRLVAGELNAEVKHYLKGELIKVYKIEPLLLKEVDGTLSAMPEIAALKAEISALDKSFREYKQAADLRELRVKNNVTALIKFAFKDYTDNVYLGGGTEEDFIKEFGFTEEQIVNLKGEENNE